MPTRNQIEHLHGPKQAEGLGVGAKYVPRSSAIRFPDVCVHTSATELQVLAQCCGQFRRANVPDPRLAPHSRAWLIADAEHSKAIQTRLGHGSIAVTMDRYGHLMDGLDDQIALHLDARARSAAPPARPQRNRDPPGIGL